jgi:3',5'-nucleoside bisphosphate phosphatase
MIDLHIHTNASDGELSAKELVDVAIENDLKIIAITDHDTIDSVQEATDYAKGKDIEIVQGIEIRTNDPKFDYQNIDIIGLFVDSQNRELIEFTDKIKKERTIQKKKMIEKLQELGLDINFEEVAKTVNGSFGRPHIARILLKKYPEFSSVQEVFDKYMSKGKPAYVHREYNVGIGEAIEIIKKSGGIPILAHPGIFNKKMSVELINYFLSLGGLGIEVYYPYDKICSISSEESQKKIEFYKKLADEKNIVISGGSDYHNKSRGSSLGKIKIPLFVVDELRKLV